MTLRHWMALGLLMLLSADPAMAGNKMTIKTATLAPDGSTWFKILESMGRESEQKTGGRVRFRIYAGGVAGDDRDVVRKMRIGQLQAGAVATAGLASIDPAFNVFSIPLFFDSYDEFFFVRDKLTPMLEGRLEEKGFKLLHWGHGGWVHVFSAEPVQTVDDLEGVKMWTWAGDDRYVQIWKDAGFHPVPLAATDILVGLQTGLIDGIPTTPYAALAMQWFRHTPNMLAAGVAPMVGGTILTMKAWEKISDDDRSILVQVGEEADSRLSTAIPKADEEAIQEMEKRGLTVVPVEPKQEAQWQAVAQEFADRMRDNIVPEDVYQLALRYRDEFRQSRSIEGRR